MKFGWDPRKHEWTLDQRGFGFDLAARIFEGEVLEAIDNRKDYGEVRIRAIGEVHGLVLHVTYTDRAGVRWIISARRANRKERNAWSGR